MITLTWGDLRNDDFLKAIDKLYKQPMGFVLGQKFVLVGREIKKQQSLLNECHEKLLKEFGTPNPEQKGHFKINAGSEAKFEKELKEMFQTKFEIKVDRIDSEKLSERIDLSPQDWLILEAFFKPITELRPVPGAGDVHDNGAKSKPDNHAN